MQNSTVLHNQTPDAGQMNTDVIKKSSALLLGSPNFRSQIVTPLDVIKVLILNS